MKKHRSVSAVAVAGIMRILYPKATTEEAILADRSMNTSGKDIPYVLPKTAGSLNVAETRFEGVQVFRVNMASSEKKLMFFLHGGGYVHQPTPYHWSFLKRLVHETGCKVVVPIYPKAPGHTWEDSYDVLLSLYLRLRQEFPDHQIYFMGDSAGGGLAMGLGQTLRDQKLPQPNGYVLVSPWVDVTMQNPDAARYAGVDALLSIPALIWWGKAWAGALSTEDARISPIFGDFTGFSSCLIFTGTREVFYPDEILLSERLSQNGVRNELVVAEGMNHDYLVLPVKEARDGVRKIASWLSGSH